jgi:hypothetical protein
MRKIWIGLGFAAGYVLGAKAGRERYQQLKEQASRLAERPEVKQATRRVADTTIGKLQQSPRASAGLQRARGFTTRVRHRRQVAPGDATADATPVPQPSMPAVD